MQIRDQLPRRALGWLILCQVAVLIPHLTRVPLWVIGVYLGSALWRFQVHRQRVSPPGRLIRLALGTGAGIAVFLSYRTLIGLEPMVTLLLVASALKILETLRDKDGYVLIALGFFICITEFLFSQSIPVVAYTLLCTILLVTGMITLNQRPGANFGWQEPLLAAKMLALAVPMMVVLFLLFPRIGPLWSVPSKTGQGTTGMSDFLRPGNVSELTRSAEVAFRVQFAEEIPAKRELYWRGMVLNRFDDGAWRTTNLQELPPEVRRVVRPLTEGDPLQYRVIMEPTMQRWLYGLPYAESPTDGIFEVWDYRLTTVKPVESKLGYDVKSWPAAPRQLELSPSQCETELALPEDLNPLTRQWVNAELAGGEPLEKVRRMLSYFRTQPFFYTLRPPPITDPNFVDRFVFESRRGFCEHYAYAFVVMMRMAGVPARIVGGYQGGEVNPLNNTVIVRQFDAHAWAEVWLQDSGWTRVDPTAAVSLARIEFGLEEALAEEGSFLSGAPLSAYRFRNIGVVNWLRLRYDSVAWQWQSFIVGFNSEKQINLLQDWFGEVRVSWFVAAMLGSWAMVLIPLTFWINRSRRVTSRLPAEQTFARLSETLARRGIERGPSESPVSLLERALVQLGADDPLLADIRRVIEDLYRTPAA